MKAKLTLAIVAWMFGLMQLQADEMKFRINEEAQVNDIPFNTALISNEARFAELMNAEFEMADEGSVDDIPFDTAAILESTKAEKSVFRMQEEGFVNDIPFNTFQVVNRLIINN